MVSSLLGLFRFLLAHPRFYRFNLHLYKLTLRSLGILNSDTAEATGEPWFINHLRQLHSASNISMRVIVDVGANDEAYGQVQFPDATIYAFEPHPASFRRLKSQAQANVVPIEAAVGDANRKVAFYDFAENAPRKKDQPTSQLATVHKAVIENFYHQPAKKYSVKMVTLDTLVKESRIDKIDLLKIDAEGNELAVLQGSRRLLQTNKIQIIQFEFNEIHAYSRVFMKDFYELLPGFTFYRLLPRGLAPLGPYRPLTHEIFGFQNIVASRKELI